MSVLGMVDRNPYFYLHSNPALSLRNNRFRRDQRALEEDEEIWFEQEDEAEEGENIVPMTDVLKNRLDADIDPFGKFMEQRKGMAYFENQMHSALFISRSCDSSITVYIGQLIVCEC